jgi:Ser/Thr protein kinase RdoA (MazF antagonist)
VIDFAGLTRRGQIRRLRRVAKQALLRYGIEPTSLSLLGHTFNTTFRVISPDGGRFVLHILRPTEAPMSESQSQARVESELWWLDRVRAELRLSVPAPVRTPSGEGVVTVAVEGMGPPRLCTLFHWLDGRFLRGRLVPAHLEAVGRLTARLHTLSAHLRVPTWFDRPSVDQADAKTEEAVARLFTHHVSPGAAEVMRAVFRRVRRAQQELGGGPDTFGLVHADIHQKNYLFGNGEVGLIDFGDCGWGHYLYDLAVTVSELEGLPHRTNLRAGLLAGYRQMRDLSSAHEALIGTFVMLREVQNLTWFLTLRDDPSYRRRTAQIGKGVTKLERQLDSGA